MGCDIHAVIECERHGSYREVAEVKIARDYKLFSAIAFGDGGITDELPYPPRGLPTDHSLLVGDLFFLEAEELREMEAEIGGGEEFQPEEIAESWGDWALHEYSKFGVLPHPDWHTPGWLRLDELKESLERAGLEIEKMSPEFRAAVASMQVLSEAYGVEKVRLVFWFDGSG